jgi:ribosomal protein L7/L12
MSTIQEIAEELVNLTVKEVNELAIVMKNDIDIPHAFAVDFP